MIKPLHFLDKKCGTRESAGFLCRLNQGKFKDRFVKRLQIRGASQLDKIHSGFL
jgi:hypothetical protein